MRDTASSDVPMKKNPMEVTKNAPEDGVVDAKDELARQRLKSSSGNGSKLLDKFASSEGEKKVPG